MKLPGMWTLVIVAVETCRFTNGLEIVIIFYVFR